MSDVTRLLHDMGEGDTNATAKLLPLIYEELKSLARQHMAHERPDHTLQATALIHEAFLRLADVSAANWDGRAHFFAAAAEAMRRILIEHARRRQALKYGGGRQRIELHDDFPNIAAPCNDLDDLLTVNGALDNLAKVDPEKALLVKLLYFAGLNLDEAAAAMGIGRTTAYRHWQFAKAWLYDAIHDPKSSTHLPRSEL